MSGIEKKVTGGPRGRRDEAGDDAFEGVRVPSRRYESERKRFINRRRVYNLLRLIIGSAQYDVT